MLLFDNVNIADYNDVMGNNMNNMLDVQQKENEFQQLLHKLKHNIIAGSKVEHLNQTPIGDTFFSSNKNNLQLNHNMVAAFRKLKPPIDRSEAVLSLGSPDDDFYKKLSEESGLKEDVLKKAIPLNDNLTYTFYPEILVNNANINLSILLKKLGPENIISIILAGFISSKYNGYEDQGLWVNERNRSFLKDFYRHSDRAYGTSGSMNFQSDYSVLGLHLSHYRKEGCRKEYQKDAYTIMQYNYGDMFASISNKAKQFYSLSKKDFDLIDDEDKLTSLSQQSSTIAKTLYYITKHDSVVETIYDIMNEHESENRNVMIQDVENLDDAFKNILTHFNDLLSGGWREYEDVVLQYSKVYAKIVDYFHNQGKYEELGRLMGAVPLNITNNLNTIGATGYTKELVHNPALDILRKAQGASLEFSGFMVGNDEPIMGIQKILIEKVEPSIDMNLRCETYTPGKEYQKPYLGIPKIIGTKLGDDNHIIYDNNYRPGKHTLYTYTMKNEYNNKNKRLSLPLPLGAKLVTSSTAEYTSVDFRRTNDGMYYFYRDDVLSEGALNISFYIDNDISGADEPGNEYFFGDGECLHRNNTKPDISATMNITQKAEAISDYIQNNAYYAFDNNYTKPTFNSQDPLGYCNNLIEYSKTVTGGKIAMICNQSALFACIMLQQMGIPARVVYGFPGGSQIGGSSHAWVEYLDGNQWKSIDPTPSEIPPAHVLFSLSQKHKRFKSIEYDTTTKKVFANWEKEETTYDNNSDIQNNEDLRTVLEPIDFISQYGLDKFSVALNNYSTFYEVNIGGYATHYGIDKSGELKNIDILYDNIRTVQTLDRYWEKIKNNQIISAGEFDNILNSLDRLEGYEITHDNKTTLLFTLLGKGFIGQYRNDLLTYLQKQRGLKLSLSMKEFMKSMGMEQIAKSKEEPSNFEEFYNIGVKYGFLADHANIREAIKNLFSGYDFMVHTSGSITSFSLYEKGSTKDKKIIIQGEISGNNWEYMIPEKDTKATYFTPEIPYKKPIANFGLEIIQELGGSNTITSLISTDRATEMKNLLIECEMLGGERIFTSRSDFYDFVIMLFAHENFGLTLDNFSTVQKIVLHFYLDRLPDCLANLNLNEFSLKSNDIEYLPKNIGALKNIRKLSMLTCNIQEIDPGILISLPKLSDIDGFASEFNHFPVYSNGDAIHKLSFRHNKLLGFNSKDLQSYPNLEYLDLSSNYISNPDLSYAPPSIKTLKLSHISFKEAINFNDLTRWNSLEELDISENPIIDFSFIASLQNLKTLNLYRSIGKDTMPSEILSLHQLESLNISGSSTLSRLPEHMYELYKLTHLDLSDCPELSGSFEVPFNCDIIWKGYEETTPWPYTEGEREITTIEGEKKIIKTKIYSKP